MTQEHVDQIVKAIFGFAEATTLGTLPIRNEGSLLRQQYTCELNGKEFWIELRPNDDAGFCTFAMSHDKTDLVRERKIVYATDLLRGVSHPSVSGLHIIPIDPSRGTEEVTPENLGRAVQLTVFSES